MTDVFEKCKIEPVYNRRIADHHTYFVGGEEWGFSAWSHNLCEASIHSYGEGLYANAVVMRVVGEVQGAVSQAVKVLKAGGTGDTRRGKIYQLSVKKGTFAKKPWLEPLFRGNAIQQIATTQLRKNHYLAELDVLFNKGSIAGSRINGNLLRPDFQFLVNGKWAVLDITTAGQVKKIDKYAHDCVGHLINIIY